MPISTIQVQGTPYSIRWENMNISEKLGKMVNGKIQNIYAFYNLWFWIKLKKRKKHEEQISREYNNNKKKIVNDR